MPYTESILLPIPGELGIWHIVEEEEYFRQRLALTMSENNYLEGLHGKRRLEWLASRMLLHEMSGRTTRASCHKDPNGKPHLKDSSMNISISHTGDMAAIMVAQNLDIGVDIQRRVEKIEYIAHKYLSSVELSMVPSHHNRKIDTLHILWGAKESLYKAYSKRGISLKQNITIPHIDQIDSSSEVGNLLGSIKAEGYDKAFYIHWEQREHYFLVYVYEILDNIARSLKNM